MKRLKGNKGITLVALIITIIVLLILAVVTIRAVNDGGIIQHAQNAKSEYEVAQEKENVYLAANQAFLIGNGKITVDNLTTALNSHIGEQGDKWEYSDVTTNPTEWIKVKIPPASPDGREYKIYMNGKVEGHLTAGGGNGDEPEIGTVTDQNGDVLELGDYIKVNGTSYVVAYNDDIHGLQIIPRQPLNITVTLEGVEGFNNHITSFYSALDNYYSTNSLPGMIDYRIPGYNFKGIYGGEERTKVYDDKSITYFNFENNSTLYCWDDITKGPDESMLDAIILKLATNPEEYDRNGYLLENDFWINYADTVSEQECILAVSYFDYTANLATGANPIIEGISYKYDNITKNESSVSVEKNILPIIQITNQIEITGGSGTKVDPYIYTFNLN